MHFTNEMRIEYKTDGILFCSAYLLHVDVHVGHPSFDALFGSSGGIRCNVAQPLILQEDTTRDKKKKENTVCK
jgi:hypothetical protein